MSNSSIGRLILRLGMAAVYLFFGFSQLFDGLNWVGMVPAWAVNLVHLPPAMIVLGNGAFEVVFGALLAAGLLVRPVAVILAIHLLVIASSFGFTPLGVRDFGLSLATLSLAFFPSTSAPKVREY
ncbi:DoxX family protein [Candidatus Parcubacteria bacterium]|nr:DoxX family protein [Candidatus Parcubacteria bacterium]